MEFGSNRYAKLSMHADFYSKSGIYPQARLISQAVKIIQKGGIMAYPTDSSYALGCHIGDAKALERIRTIRQAGPDHNFTLVCADLSEISPYARFENWAYRLIKSGDSPGALGVDLLGGCKRLCAI